MATISLQSSFNVDYSLPLSLQDFLERYLPGIPLPSSISDSVVENFLRSATSEVESYLGLKIMKQIITEDKDFRDTDWSSWGYIPVMFPCVSPLSLEGWLGTTKQVTYPKDWLSIRHTNDNKNYSRRISLVPVRNSVSSTQVLYTGIIPQANMFGWRQIPNYWTMKYVTGWDVPPPDIIDAIGMLTAIKLLQIISDALMAGSVRQTTNSQGQPILQSSGTAFQGLGLGIASKSLSIDGLSQSYSSYANGQTGIWGARLKSYAEQLDTSKSSSLLRRLYDTYQAIVMSVC